MPRKLKKLTVARLRAWLEAQPADATFMVRSGRHCPVAEFVDEDHWVYTTHIALHDPHGDGGELKPGSPKRVELPAWVKAFIKEVDKSDGLIYGQSPIGRDKALAILSGVTARRPAK